MQNNNRKGPFKIENSPSAIVNGLTTPLFGSGMNEAMDNWYTRYILEQINAYNKTSFVGILKKNKAVIIVE